MKNNISYVLVLILLVSLFSTNVLAATGGKAPLAADLNTGLPATVLYGSWLAGTNSTLNIVIRDLPADAGIPNGLYAGWCIQDRITGGLKNEPGTLYASTSENLPSDLADLPWNQVNYLLNHKIRGEGKSNGEFHKDVQTAVWLLLGYSDLEFGTDRPEALQMVADANAHPDYVPGDGDILAVIVYSDGMNAEDPNSVQEAIIEFRLPRSATLTPTPTGTLIDTPTNTFTPTPTGTLIDTPTNTFTPTVTVTPSACVPSTVTADFSRVAVGQSVEGMGAVAPDLNIDAKGTAIKLLPAVDPTFYVSTKDGVKTVNGYMVSGGGFSDLATKNAGQAHLYTFTFASGVSVSSFSVHMLDFGDINPSNTTNHYASMIGYDANGVEVSRDELNYTTLAETYPQSSDLYGNLQTSGDASAPSGQPGNWTWSVSGTDIVKVVLEFGAGFDPNVGFDLLTFANECGTLPADTPTPTVTVTPSVCVPSTVTADFSRVAVGQSVEGMGAVAPDLNIDAAGTAIKLLPTVDPTLYVSTKDGVKTVNGYMVSGGGFSDLSTKNAGLAHSYDFTFASGVSVSSFSVRMLDFGDINPSNTVDHYASLIAYDANGVEVSRHELDYTTLVETFPQSSDLYGNLQISGDASAPSGQPGNWTWGVSGTEIVRVALEFGDGFDPNIAFDTITFANECP